MLRFAKKMEVCDSKKAQTKTIEIPNSTGICKNMFYLPLNKWILRTHEYRDTERSIDLPWTLKIMELHNLTTKNQHFQNKESQI